MKKKPFLLKYSGKNTEGYYLVYATSEKKAIEKLKNHYWFIDNLFVELATIL